MRLKWSHMASVVEMYVVTPLGNQLQDEANVKEFRFTESLVWQMALGSILHRDSLLRYPVNIVEDWRIYVTRRCRICCSLESLITCIRCWLKMCYSLILLCSRHCMLRDLKRCLLVLDMSIVHTLYTDILRECCKRVNRIQILVEYSLGRRYRLKLGRLQLTLRLKSNCRYIQIVM